MIAEIQCLPSPAGTPTSTYAHIEAAIGVVARSGLRYEVGALGTTVEGPADDVWTVLRAAHEATIAAGAESVVSVIKAFSATADGPGIDDLVAAHR
ncbi:MAG: thiamine-binding protein [Jiangellales bacterium]